jgi:uncharacterized protein (TIGR00255 family)
MSGKSGSPTAPVSSMTGFASAESPTGETRRFRIEIKTLNHRFLDIKCRMPRDLSSAEIPLRAFLQKEFARGSLDIKVERIESADAAEATGLTLQQIDKAKAWLKTVRQLQNELSLTDAIRTQDLLSVREIFESGETPSLAPEEAWKAIEPVAAQAAKNLRSMRQHEGAALVKALLDSCSVLESTLDSLRRLRTESIGLLQQRNQERIRAVFESHPLPAGTPVQAVLESRIAQELGILLDRTDIEEELTRFGGHLEHLRKTLHEGGPVGRKLEFLLQELGREINTLGNKAQDLPASEQVLAVKVRLEQIREQVLNLE